MDDFDETVAVKIAFWSWKGVSKNSEFSEVNNSRLSAPCTLWVAEVRSNLP